MKKTLQKLLILSLVAIMCLTSTLSMAEVSYSGWANQQWAITDTGNGKYKIINRNSGKAVDVSGHSMADGGEVIQWTYNGGNNQLWTLVRIQ